MTSNTEAASETEQTEAHTKAAARNFLGTRGPEIDARPFTLIVRAFNRLFAGRLQRVRRQPTVERLLRDSFGSISPAYLFSAVPKELPRVATPVGAARKDNHDQKLDDERCFAER